jgi:hypothetical protein
MTEPTGDPNREVAIVYTVKGDAEQKAQGLARAFEGVHRAADAAKTRVSEVARSMAVGALGAVGLSLGLREVWEHSKDVNLSMESMQKQVAGATFAFATWKKGTTGLEKWRESMRDGVEITEKLEKVSQRHKVSREELSSIYASQTQMSERYRQSQGQQIDFTEKLAAAHNVLGISAEGAGQIIARAALTGSIPVRTELGRALAGGVGNLKAFRRESEEVRFEKLKKAMGDLVPASMEMGKGMKGALFDIHEAGTEIFRDLTKPMFTEQTKSLREWAANLTKVREDGKSIAHEYGETIAKAFVTIKDVSGAIAEHWKVIGGFLIAGKLGKVAGGMMNAFKGPAAAGAAGALGGGSVASMTVQAANVVVNSASLGGAIGATTSAAVTKSTSGGLARFATGVAGCASKMFIAAEAAGALAVAAAAWVDEWQAGKLKQQQVAPVQTMNALHAGVTAMKTQGEEQARHLKSVSEAFGLKAGQHVSAQSIAAGLTNMPASEAAALAGRYGLRGETAARAGESSYAPQVANQIAQKLNDLIDIAVKQQAGAFKEEEKSNKAKAARAAPITNIGVVNLTQDFKADDPERIFHRASREMVRELNMLGDHPTSSPAARNNL